LDDWNVNTRPMHPIISNQFTSGTYTCPRCDDEVWLIFTRGK